MHFEARAGPGKADGMGLKADPVGPDPGPAGGKNPPGSPLVFPAPLAGDEAAAGCDQGFGQPGVQPVAADPQRRQRERLFPGEFAPFEPGDPAVGQGPG